MAKFRVRSGTRGSRSTIVVGPDIVTVRRRFKKNHPRTEIDGVELVRRSR